MLLLAAIAGTLGASALAEAAADDAAPAAYVLSDAQLDRVTAGATVISLELAAVAHGLSAFTSTEGLIRHLRGRILMIDAGPGRPAGPGTMREQTGELAYGFGRAHAEGGTDAAASASLGLQGPVSFLRLTTLAAATPGSATAVVAFVSFAFDR